MFDLLTRWLRPTTRKTARRAPRLRVEALEDRAVPAGLIDVTFQGGVLKILGDANANTLTVSQQADGRLTLTTDIGGGLRVNGQTVNGFMGYTLPAPVAGGVTVNLGGGFDTLRFDGFAADLDLPSFLSVNLGDGNNDLTFANGVTVSGDVTVTGGAGLDTTHLYDVVNVLGKMTINNGSGGSLLDSNATGDVHVLGTLSVVSGAGFDKLDLTAAQKVTLGAFVQKTGADLDGSNTDLSPVQQLWVNGAVTVVNGAGADDLDIGDSSLATHVGGAVTVTMGAGNNHTDVVGTDSLFVGGPLTFTGGAAGDLVHLGLNSNHVTLGAVTVNSGGGDNGTAVEGLDLLVTGGVTVNGGAGSDQVVIDTNGGAVLGAVKMTLGAGNSSVALTAADAGTLALGKTLTVTTTGAAPQFTSLVLRDVKVMGTTTVVTGAGDDTVALDDVTFNGAFTVSTGLGADKVNIEQDATRTGRSVFAKAVSVATGAGDDTILVSGVLPADAQKAYFLSSVSLNGGAGSDVLQNLLFVNAFYGPTAKKVGIEFGA